MSFFNYFIELNLRYLKYLKFFSFCECLKKIIKISIKPTFAKKISKSCQDKIKIKEKEDK